MPVAPSTGASTGIDEDQADTSAGGVAPTPPAMPRWRRLAAPDQSQPGSPWMVLVLWALLAVPLAVALAVLRTKHWVPIGDIAQTELRVRDAWSRHPPLIGLAGRIGPFSHQGSHPGPLSFWALWPMYRLFGATPMALVASGTFLQLLAVGGSLWLAYRRGGVRLLLAAALILAMLTRSYGAVTLTEPWNPYLPLMWWFLFLCALWSVLCDDLVAFPIAIFAGSFCMETHISYLGLIGGLSIVLIVGAVLAVRARRDDFRRRRQALWWVLGGVVLGIMLWIPPVIDQLTAKTPNGTVIWRHFTNPPEVAIGLTRGAKLVLAPLAWWWVNSTRPTPPAVANQAMVDSTAPGLVVLAVWVIAAIVAWRLGHRALIRLHAVVGAGLLLGLISAAKIFGPLYNYLVLWAWSLGALVFLAIGWTIAIVLGRRMPAENRQRARIRSTAVLAAGTVLVVALFTVNATSVGFRAPRPSEILRRVVGPTASALAKGNVPGGGRRGRYLVTWNDPISLGTQGFGLISELERRGFRVGADEFHGPGVTVHRVFSPGHFTGVIHFAVGQDVQLWQAKPGVRQVAYVDLRSAKEQAEYGRLRLQVIADLRAADMEDQVEVVDGNLYGASTNMKLSPRTFRRMVRMLDLGLPTAVFVGPPSSID